MKDRVVQYPNRFKMIPVPGQADTYDMVAAPGTITEAGDPLNKANLFSDATASVYGLTGTNASPDKALLKIAQKYVMNRKIFTSNGTLAIPYDVTSIRITGCAAGGKGSDSPTYPEINGKAGEYVFQKEYAVTPGSFLNITVGTGNTIITGVTPACTLLANTLSIGLNSDLLGLGFPTGVTPATGGGYGGAFGFGGGVGGNVANGGLTPGAGGGAGGYGAGGGACGKNQGGFGTSAGGPGAGLTSPRELGGLAGGIGLPGGKGSIIANFKSIVYSSLYDLGLIFDTAGGGAGGNMTAIITNIGGESGKGVLGGTANKGGNGSPGFVMIEFMK